MATLTSTSKDIGLTEELLESIVADIVAKIETSMLGLYVRKAAESDVSKANVKLSDLKKGVTQVRSRSPWQKRLGNAVFQHLQMYHSHIDHCRPRIMIAPAICGQAAWMEHEKEPIAYVRRAQVNWEKRILKSINSMCTELNVPLARKRGDKEQREMLAKWTELGTNEPDLAKFRPVYAAKDFLDVITSMKNTNQVNCADNSVSSSSWGIVQVPQKVKNISELQEEFAETSLSYPQTGVDDAHDVPAELYEADRNRLAAGVAAAKHSGAAREFAKRGCPLTHRASLWCCMLGLEVDDVDIMYYDKLKSCVLQHHLLVDSLIYKDVKLTATNDDQYFVFEDYLYQVLLPFSRDTAVLDHFAHSSASPARAYIRGRLGSEDSAVYYPPNGVIPFHGFAMYVAPLCYMYNDPCTLYYVFRTLYTRYFHRLHALSTHPQGIVSLCILFESLVQTHEPRLFLHLLSVGVQPLRLAFKWLVRAFSGYLGAEQVLLVWDRILAYGSLEILPVLAAAIFSFRKANLMQVQTVNAAEAVLVDLLTLDVMPLIQLFLFPAQTPP